jgi:hypothetical protein
MVMGKIEGDLFDRLLGSMMKRKERRKNETD